MAIPLALHVQHADLSLGGRPILQGIDLELPRGQVLALLGGSGCGKTTLLRAIAGLQALDRGRIELDGRDVSDLPTAERGIGVVFQQYALFPNLSVRDNIAFGLQARREPLGQQEARVTELLQLIGLSEHAMKRPAQLSGGQRQRVALARALAPRPSLLLMDEPFSALDENFRVPLRRSFRQLQRELGQSCVLVTHDRDEAYELADRVAVMFEGRMEQCNPPAELWASPCSRRVADFLGTFNQLDARLAPGQWQRERGHWIAPVEALRLVSGSTEPDAWRIEAQVTAAYTGRTGVSVELAGPSAQKLTMTLPVEVAVPKPGAKVTVALTAQSLAWLAE